MRIFIRTLLWLVVVAILFYPVVGNVLLFSGALESIISRKPEKLKIEWDHAWTLIPGKVNVEGFHLNIHTRKNHILIDVNEAVADISLLALLRKSVEISSIAADGLEFSYQKRTDIKEPVDSKTPELSAVPAEIPGVDAGETESKEPADIHRQKKKKPWTITLNDVSSTGVRTVRFHQLNLAGMGELRNLAMRIITKGGPLRIDDISLNMRAKVSTDLDLDDPDQRFADIDARIRLDENVPKQNKGRKLMKFLSARLEVTGSSAGIGFLTALLPAQYSLSVSGGGELNMLAIIESGELKEGSRVKFTSEHFDTDFLQLHASGSGSIDASIDSSRAIPVKMKINVNDFSLNRQNLPNPYMEGANLNLELGADRIFLSQEMVNPRLYVHFPDSIVRELTDYNRFIPKQAPIRIVEGAGRLRGTMQLNGDKGLINMELDGSDVVLDIAENRISTDLKIVTNLSDGSYGDKSFNLTGTYFRMEKTLLVRGDEKTKNDWWGEIRIEKGDVLLNEPVDIDGEMRVKMRDTQPLLALFREEGKKEGFLDKILNIKNLEGTIGIQTTEKKLTLDPILIDGNGLKIISKLDMVEKSMDGALYVKLRGVAINFDIRDGKTKFKGFGGKKRVKKLVSKPSRHINPHDR